MANTNKNFTLESIVEQLLHHLTVTRQITVISKQFSKLESNSVRVDFVYRLLEEFDLLPALVPDLKNQELATEIRQKGNAMFKIRKNAEAIEFYTRSVALAEEGSEHLALAYANRSAVLLEMGFCEESLMDIGRALKSNYPENLKPKLLTRQEKAKNLKLKQSYRNDFEPIPEIAEERKNALIQCAAESIELRHTEDHGRHVVAKRHIFPGEVLAVEKPFCHILIGQYYSHCHNCLKLCYNLIPCTKCTQTLYCNEECRSNAFFYHRYECNILATIKELGLDKLKLLPLKIALLVRDQYSTIKEINAEDDNFYRSDRYKEIHNLVSNTCSRSVSDLFDRSSTSSIIYYLIKKFTDFFKSATEEVIFKELVLLHLQTGACNFHEISELAENQQGIYEPDEIGAGAFSFLSMFNHRCCPNVVRDCYGPVIVMRAMENIKKGEQCYDNYGYHYAIMSKSERKAKLKKQYFFDCTCDVCKNEWPLYKDLSKIESDVRVVEGDVLKLQAGDVETAKRVLKKTLPKLQDLEKVKPNRNLAEIQEIIKQCFGILGNVRRTL